DGIRDLTVTGVQTCALPICRLMQAIERLTPEQQQIITMRFIDGLDVEEIARLTHRRPGSIHSMQHRALASLYRFLLEQEEVEAQIGRASWRERGEVRVGGGK